jgi:hypothetical protein
MMSPGVSPVRPYQRRGRKRTGDAITVEPRAKKSFPFCSDMKQDINFIVSYWNMNSCETMGLRSRSALCRAKKVTSRTIVDVFHHHGRQKGKIISLSGLSTLMKRGEKGALLAFSLSFAKTFH